MQLCASKIDMIGDLSFNGFLFFHVDYVYFAPLLPPMIIYLGSHRVISNMLCVLFYLITRMEQFPQRIRPLIQLLCFCFYCLCLESTWSLKSHLTRYYQTLAELICQFLGRLDEFIFYFTICNLINQLQFLQRYLIFSTAPLDAIVCMEDSSLRWTVLYSYISRVIRFSLK